MTPTPEAIAKARAIALEPSQRILGAVEALPEHIRGGVCWGLLTDHTFTLSSIGEAMREPHGERAEHLATALTAEMFIGDLEPVAAALADDSEPWATIKDALSEVAHNWRRVHPTFRTTHDRTTTPAGEKASST